MTETVTIRVAEGDSKDYVITLLAGNPQSAGAEVLAKSRAKLANGFVRSLSKCVLAKTADAKIGDVAEFGAKLGDFLLAGEVGGVWESKLPARTYLDVTPAELQNIPWEFARRNASLFVRERSPLVLYRSVAKGREFEAEAGLRILVVVAAQDLDDKIGSGVEVRAIRDAIRPLSRIIDVLVRRWLSRDKLRAAINEYRPHVLHIIGHGDGNGPQLYDGDANRLDPWGAVEVETDLGSWTWIPELVYLNTCRSADAGPMVQQGQKQQWNVVRRLLANEVPAVVAMHADIRGPLAAEGARAFYQALAKREAIDVAAAASRRSITHCAAGREASFEPYLPQLVVTRPVENILRYTAAVEVDRCPDLEETLKTFVDRDQDRRTLVPIMEAGNRVVVIEGEPSVGKSWLLHWCMDAWRRRNMAVRYVHISGCGTWLDVVRAIRDGSPGKTGSIYQGMPDTARSLLNWRLNALARGVADPAVETLHGGIVEDRPRTDVLVDPAQAMIDAHIKAMAALQAALDEEAQGRKFVIVLDSFSMGDQGLTRAQFSTLCEHWIVSLLVKSQSNTCAVLVAQPAQLKEYGLETMPSGFKKIPLGYFSFDEFAELMLDLVPLVYDEELGERRDSALSYLRQQLQDYDPRELNEPLSGTFLREQCKTIWTFCKSKKRSWDK